MDFMQALIEILRGGGKVEIELSGPGEGEEESDGEESEREGEEEGGEGAAEAREEPDDADAYRTGENAARPASRPRRGSVRADLERLVG